MTNILNIFNGGQNKTRKHIFVVSSERISVRMRALSALKHRGHLLFSGDTQQDLCTKRLMVTTIITGFWHRLITYIKQNNKWKTITSTNTNATHILLCENCYRFLPQPNHDRAWITVTAHLLWFSAVWSLLQVRYFHWVNRTIKTPYIEDYKT